MGAGARSVARNGASGLIRLSARQIKRVVFFGSTLFSLGALLLLFQRFDWIVVPAGFDALEPSVPAQTRLMVDRKWQSARLLKSGDIVVLGVPGEGDARQMLSRVVAVAGDLLGIDGSLLLVNGKVSGDSYPESVVGVSTVPEGRILVLNTNLDSPYPDSRTWGLVDVDWVQSRVIFFWRP